MILPLTAGAAVAYGPLVAAIPVALLAGVVSFVSPCCLPLVPGYLAYVTGTAGADATGPPGRRSTAVLGTGLFVLGFAAVFTSYGVLFGTLGSTLIRHQHTITVVLGVLTVIMGLSFAGLLTKVPGLSRTARIRYRPRDGLVGAPILGAMFGLGWTPCIGPTLAAVLTLATTQGTAARGAILAFAYSLGIGIPFMLAALGLDRVFKSFAFARRHARTVMRIGGGFLIMLGVLEVTGLWAAWIASLQTLIGGWQSPL